MNVAIAQIIKLMTDFHLQQIEVLKQEGACKCLLSAKIEVRKLNHEKELDAENKLMKQKNEFIDHITKIRQEYGMCVLELI